MRDALACLPRLLIGWPLFAIGYVACWLSHPVKAGYRTAESHIADADADRASRLVTISGEIVQ